MRRRKCSLCGAEFDGEKEQRLCPACRAAAKLDTVVRDRVCATCGITFPGGPRAKYCPACRAERKRDADRRHKRTGAQRPLGSTDICTVCGKPYIVTSGLQRYCPDCAAQAVRQKVLPTKRAYAAANKDKNIQRKQQLKDASAICAYCGKPYTPHGPAVTCSPECAKEYKRIVQGNADYKRGKRKTPPAHKPPPERGGSKN